MRRIVLVALLTAAVGGIVLLALNVILSTAETFHNHDTYRSLP